MGTCQRALCSLLQLPALPFTLFNRRQGEMALHQHPRLCPRHEPEKATWNFSAHFINVNVKNTSREMNTRQARASLCMYVHHLISYNWKLRADRSIEKSHAWNDGKILSVAHLQNSALDAAVVRGKCACKDQPYDLSNAHPEEWRRNHLWLRLDCAHF